MLKYFLIFCLLSLTFSINKNAFNDLIVESADRKIDLRDKYPQMTTTMKIKNQGTQKFNSIYLAVREDWAKQLYLLKINQGKINSQYLVLAGSSNELIYKVIEDLEIKKNHNALLFEVKLEKELKPQEKVSLTIKEKYYNIMQFLPKQIKIKDDQKVLFEGNAYILSPYLIETQKTEFTLSASPMSHTDIPSMTNQNAHQIIYGNFENIKAFSVQALKIHFINNTPFALFKSVKQIIEVSHWGNIAIQTFYKLKNEGAQFTGEYSRVDYNQYMPNAGKSALKSLTAELPYHAWGVYYRDEIGNVSTSHSQRRLKDKDVKLEITPRFSLFGGWKSNFEIGYNLPLHHYLFQSSTNPNEYTLNQIFGFPFEGFIAEEYEMRIILPEGASNFESQLPFLVDETTSITYSYLDTIGKPTLVFKKNLISDYHHQLFTIKYTLDKQNMLIKPALLFLGFLLLFMAFIAIKRMELKSFKVSDETKTQ